MRPTLMIFILCLCLAPPAGAEWVSLTAGLDEADITRVTADIRNPDRLFAAADKDLYRSLDGGKKWKKILSVRGEGNKINFVLLNPHNPDEVLVATEKGVRHSSDGGVRWEYLFSGMDGQSRQTTCLGLSPSDTGLVAIGTARGLYIMDRKTRQVKRISAVGSEEVRSVMFHGDEALVSTENGIYRNRGGADYWERVFSKPGGPSEPAAPLEQFSIEEIFPAPYFQNLAYSASGERFYAATREGILEASQDGSAWAYMDGQNLPDKKINSMACSSGALYVATDRGVFQGEPGGQSFRSISGGLESGEVNALFYNPGGDYLLAATQRGIFKYAYPELKLEVQNKETAFREKTGVWDVLSRFSHEPTIQEIRDAAIRYAEVHPDKIKQWRRAAALKAFLPSVSFDSGLSADESVDLDRGGTNDPDTFIIGPQEKSYDWSVGFNWDLGELLWNDDQTGIDTRSKLMVELRDDILNEVTHLYFERRRLQVEMELGATRELPLQIEKEIRLQELTAGIDALTGGFFSKNIANPRGGKIHS